MQAGLTRGRSDGRADRAGRQTPLALLHLIQITPCSIQQPAGYCFGYCLLTLYRVLSSPEYVALLAARDAYVACVPDRTGGLARWERLLPISAEQNGSESCPNWPPTATTDFSSTPSTTGCSKTYRNPLGRPSASSAQPSPRVTSPWPGTSRSSRSTRSSSPSRSLSSPARTSPSNSLLPQPPHPTDQRTTGFIKPSRATRSASPSGPARERPSLGSGGLSSWEDSFDRRRLGIELRLERRPTTEQRVQKRLNRRVRDSRSVFSFFRSSLSG